MTTCQDLGMCGERLDDCIIVITAYATENISKTENIHNFIHRKAANKRKTMQQWKLTTEKGQKM